MKNREIDILVAEKVMGWKKGANFGVLDNGYGVKFVVHDTLGEFSPTLRIEDAWQVVEKFRTFDMSHVHDAFYVTVMRKGNEYTAEGATAQMAICKAALKAVGIEIEPEEE